MQVTDYDITGSAFTLFRENEKESSIEYSECCRREFIKFIAEWKGYLYDVRGILVIPVSTMKYDLNENHFYLNDQVVNVYDFDTFINNVSHDDRLLLFSEFAESELLKWEFQEPLIDEGDPAEEAHREYRRMNRV